MWAKIIVWTATHMILKKLKYLLEGNEDKSKSKHLKYYQLKIQPYLLSKNTTTRQKKYLFRFRTRMIRVGHNYGRKVSCPICQTNESDTQEHMFNCVVLKLLSSELYHMIDLKYADIYSSNPQKLDKISKCVFRHFHYHIIF